MLATLGAHLQYACRELIIRLLHLTDRLVQLLEIRREFKSWDWGFWPPSRLKPRRTYKPSGLRRAALWEFVRRDSFEVYGLDLVLDEHLQPWLIEVNESPNLGAHASSLKEGMLQPMLTSLVDLVLGQRFTDGAHGKPAAPPVRTVGQRVGGWELIHASECRSGPDAS